MSLFDPTELYPIVVLTYINLVVLILMIDWLDAYLPNILPLLSTGVLQLMIVPVIVILPISVFTMLETHKGFGDTIICLYVCMYVCMYVEKLPSDF